MAERFLSERSVATSAAAGGPASPSLLRQASEFYSDEPRHSRHEAAMFEELFVQLLPVTQLSDKLAIARLLADYPETPHGVRHALLNDAAPVAGAYIATAPSIPDVDLLALIATRPADEIEAIALRRDLSPTVVEALVNKLTPRPLATLLANPRIRLSEDIVERLVARAAGDRGLAIALSERLDDVRDTDLIDLFLLLDGRGRRRVIQALEISALREFAARRPMQKPLPPSADKTAVLARACLSHDTAVMAAALSDILGISAERAASLLNDAGGEPLAVALKAAAIDPALATRVILFSGQRDTRTYQDVKRLVELFEQVSVRSATLLVDRWRSRPVGKAGIRSGRLVPQSQEGTPLRSQPPRERPEETIRSDEHRRQA